MTKKTTNPDSGPVGAAATAALVLLPVVLWMNASAQADSHCQPLTAITLSAGATGDIDTFTSTDLTLGVRSGIYLYAVTVENSYRVLAIDVTTGTGYEEEFWRYSQLNSRKSGHLLRDLASSIAGHQAALEDGATNLSCYVSNDESLTSAGTSAVVLGGL